MQTTFNNYGNAPPNLQEIVDSSDQHTTNSPRSPKVEIKKRESNGNNINITGTNKWQNQDINQNLYSFQKKVEDTRKNRSQNNRSKSRKMLEARVTPVSKINLNEEAVKTDYNLEFRPFGVISDSFKQIEVDISKHSVLQP